MSRAGHGGHNAVGVFVLNVDIFCALPSHAARRGVGVPGEAGIRACFAGGDVKLAAHIPRVSGTVAARIKSKLRGGERDPSRVRERGGRILACEAHVFDSGAVVRGLDQIDHGGGG